MYIDSYEQLGRDEERQINEAMKASLESYRNSVETSKVSSNLRTRKRHTRSSSEHENKKLHTLNVETGNKSEDISGDAKDSNRKKRTIIRQKSGEKKSSRKVPAISSNSRKPPVKRKALPTPVSLKPTLPLHEDSDTVLQNDDFIDYLCSRKSNHKHENKKSEEESSDLVIAEDDNEKDIEDFSIFEFDDDTKKPAPVPTEKTASPSKHRKLKKRRITQNYYNAKLRISDLTENSALESVPVFRPTGEEFKNFHAYLEKITPQLVSHGMCKVIPPFKWRPPKQVIPEDIRFATKSLEIHRLCHRSGPSSTVLSQIKAHLIYEHGFEWKGSPQIGNVVVDLTRFSWLMKRNGGLQVVIDKNKWGKIGDALGIPQVAERNTQLEDVYCKYLLSYDLISDEEKQNLKMDECNVDEDIEHSGKPLSLSGLRRHDNNIRKIKFPVDGVTSATFVEQEFWRLLCSAEEHFEALHGLESTITHGSGFPAYEPRHIATSDWNLTNLKGLPDGIVGFLPDVPFITQPKLEFSSLFSCAGWHAQPHFLPLISYNHFTHPRIWYSVPTTETKKLLSTMHDIAPRLNSGQHILDSKSIMIPPAELSAEQIEVFRAVQKPGEFIITSPKTYLSYINLGLTVIESVNFATEEWLHYSAESISLYQSLKLKPPLNIPLIIIEVFKKLDSLNENSLRSAEPYLTGILTQEMADRKGCKLPLATFIQDIAPSHCAECLTACHLSCVRPGDKIPTVSDKRQKNKQRTPVYCIKHSSHIKVGVLEARISNASIERFLSILNKRLHPKRSIVHPVQSLPRSVCRPLKSTISPSKQAPPATPQPSQASNTAVTAETSTSNTTAKPPSPVCPASPEETESSGAGRLNLVVPTKPLPRKTEITPLSTNTTAPIVTTVSNTSTNVTTTLPRPIPIKPMKPSMMPNLAQITVNPQNFMIAPQQPALWELWHPGMSGMNPR